jgi:uncharacterized protein with HEPN domain
MSRHDDLIRLHHMRDYAHEAIELSQGKTREDLDNDRLLELALVRLMEIIGEAAARVTQTTQQQLPDIPWREVTAMRNRLIHGYDRIDNDILWDTIEFDLPPLIVALDAFLSSIEQTNTEE